jgi:hypothetical protein
MCMMHRVWSGGTSRIATAALVLSLAIAPSALAKGGPDKGGFDKGNDHAIPDCSRASDDDHPDFAGGDKLTCPGHQTLVRTEEKPCPEKPGRPALIRKRVCCQHGDTVSCRPFRPCPPRSPS